MRTGDYPPGTHGGDLRAPWNEPDPPECMNGRCCATLEREWEWCPYCGWHIEWERWDERRGEWR